jgi:hypothetical protein
MSVEPRRRRINARFLGLCGVAFVTAACGAVSGSSSSNGGVVPISQSGTYSYTTTITSPTPGASNQGSGGCSGFSVTLTNDGGTIENLAASGTLYFTAGNWTGALDGSGNLGCQWAVTLTPS